MVKPSKQSSSQPGTPGRRVVNKSSNVLQTSLKQPVPISESFLEYQQEANRNISTTDVHLICSDGVIPVHAVVLQSVSPFFEMMFNTQGDYYFGNRPVIIPNWGIQEITRMVQFIYTGIFVQTKREVEELKELLEFFQINVKPEDLRTEKRNARVRNTKDQEVLTLCVGDLEDILPSSGQFHGSAGKEPSGLKRKGEEDISPVAKRISVAKKGEGTLDKETIVVIPVNKPLERTAASKNLEPVPQKKDVEAVFKNKDLEPSKNKELGPASKKKDLGPDSKKQPGPKSAKPAKKKVRNISSTDSSDGDIDWVESKDRDWFKKEACRCQRCDKTYSNPAEASSCLTNTHNRLRCYMCFKVVRSTAKLFVHFAKKHKRGSKEQTLLCGWCDQTVPFKSVSCHVISLHLTGMLAGITPTPCAFRKPGRIPTRRAITGTPNANKEKTDNANGKENGLTIRNQDGDDIGGAALCRSEKQTIRFRSIQGNTRVFVVALKH